MVVFSVRTCVEFCKAQVSSVVSTVCDFCVTALIFTLLHHVVISAASGAITGGVVNCIINYFWTFKGTSRSKRGVVGRYFLVWVVSLLLNTYGTEFAVKFVNHWLDVNLTLVMVMKAIVAILVAVCWNFSMQKYYVYKKS